MKKARVVNHIVGVKGPKNAHGLLDFESRAGTTTTSPDSLID